MKDSTLMKYDPNTGPNCFYTADMSGNSLWTSTNSTGGSNTTILYTQNSNLFKSAYAVAAYGSRYVGIFELKDSKKYP